MVSCADVTIYYKDKSWLAGLKYITLAFALGSNVSALFSKRSPLYNAPMFDHSGGSVPIFKEGQLDIISHSPEQSQRLGMRLGALLQRNDVICLSGDMGAGKTVFAAGIGLGWGAKLPLTSPTFNLVHEHSREADSQRLFHLDCYRLQKPSDAEGIGLDDILNGRGPAILEWPEHLETVLPRQRLWIELRVLEPTRRNFTFLGTGARYETLITQFREATFGV
jgi:tRNA threonylcarbamoyladenosine biosynthesis protein TsaE